MAFEPALVAMDEPPAPAAEQRKSLKVKPSAQTKFERDNETADAVAATSAAAAAAGYTGAVTTNQAKEIAQADTVDVIRQSLTEFGTAVLDLVSENPNAPALVEDNVGKRDEDIQVDWLGDETLVDNTPKHKDTSQTASKASGDAGASDGEELLVEEDGVDGAGEENESPEDIA